MKKLLISLGLTLATVISFAQSYIAYHFRVGDRDNLIEEMKWSDWQETDGIEITLLKQKLIINSPQVQEYLVGDKNWFDDVEGFFWNSYSVKGKPCRIYYIFTDQSYLGVEFDNIGIEYKITKK